MTAVTDLSTRRDGLAAAMERHPAGKGRGTCPPQAAMLHRLASLITAENLPPAHIVINGPDVIVDASGEELVQNVVRRWAQALDLLVTEVAYDNPDGTAAVLWSGSGWDGTGTWWHVAGAQPVPAVTS